MTKKKKNEFSLGLEDETEKNFQDKLNNNIKNETDEVLQDVMADFLEEGTQLRKTCSYYLLEKIDGELERQVDRINRAKAEKGKKFKKINKGQLLEKILLKTLNLE
jgi:uncharacterized protein YicC (UPF0701 family)